MIVAKRRLLGYSIRSMEGSISAFQEFIATAAAATTIIRGFSTLTMPKPPEVDVQRITRLQNLADELERLLSQAEHVLEAHPPLASLKDLKSQLSALREKYAVCLRHWREAGGQAQTPPILWRRLQSTRKTLERLYEDVCDHITFVEAETEEAEPMPPGKLEDLVRAAHQKEREKVP